MSSTNLSLAVSQFLLEFIQFPPQFRDEFLESLDAFACGAVRDGEVLAAQSFPAPRYHR